jgi:hypothetical protein
LLEFIVRETIRCKLRGEEGHLLVRFSSMVGWMSLQTTPLWFSLLIYIRSISTKGTSNHSILISEVKIMKIFVLLAIRASCKKKHVMFVFELTFHNFSKKEYNKNIFWYVTIFLLLELTNLNLLFPFLAILISLSLLIV